MRKKLVLASASPRRKELLAQMGLTFSVQLACKEEELSTEDPEEAVKELAYQKAFEVAQKQSEPSLVIGSDTVVAFRGKILGKPSDEEEAVSMLRMLSGQEHAVYTGVAVIDTKTKETVVHFADRTVVSMYPMSEAWIQAYVKSGEPMDKAGAYGIQGGCMPYIRGIQGEYATVVGFPAARFYQELLKKGMDLLERREEEK